MALSQRPKKPGIDDSVASVPRPTIFTLGDGDRTASKQRYERITTKDKARVHLGNAYNIQNHYYRSDAFVDSDSESDQDSHQEEPQELSDAQRRAKARREKLKKAKKLLEAFAYPRMGSRASSVSTVFSNTCRWITGTPEFGRWRSPALQSRNHGFFWLKGKPGAGKSTVMKSLITHLQTTYTSEKHVSFFFNGRGHGNERTVEGMFRTLLHQLSKDVPELPELVHEEALGDYMERGWPQELLKDLFREAVRRVTHVRPLNCCIDALDESDDEDELRDMVSFLEDVADEAVREERSFFVCLSSRHHPNISIGHCQELVLDDHEEHAKDIALYVQGKLKLRNLQLENNLGAEVTRRSTGVFLWVVLVVNMLKKSVDYGYTDQLSDQLQILPQGLACLLEDIADVGDPDERFLPAVQWVMFSYRSLTAIELYFAIKCSVGRLDENTIRWDKNLVNETVVNDFIVSSSRGLIEVVPDHVHGLLSGEVRFIHETVKDFFLDHGLQDMDPSLADNVIGDSHMRLSELCQLYLDFAKNIPIFRRIEEFELHDDWTLAANDLPLLPYALDGWLMHAEAAARRDRHAKTLDYVNVPCFGGFWLVKRVIWKYAIGNPFLSGVCTTMLHVLAFEGHAHLVKILLSQYPPELRINYIHVHCGAVGNALHIASSRGWPSVVLALIENGVDVEAQCGGMNTALHYACKEGRLDVVRILLQQGATVDARRNTGRPPLLAAIEGCHVAVIEELLENGADMGPNGTHLYNVAFRVASKSHDFCEIVRVLLHGCRDVRLKEGFGTAWSIAVQDWHFEAMRQLLERGAGVDDKVWTATAGGTALVFAAERGDIIAVQTLLQYGADINASDTRGMTALHAAAGHLTTGLIPILVQKGADIDSRSASRQTPLHIAVEEGMEDNVSCLLGFRADTEIVNERGRTALLTAVDRGNLTIASLLLRRGADVEVRHDGLFWRPYGYRPLWSAVKSGYSELVVMLLIHGADVHAQHRGQESVLDFAVENSDEEIVRLLKHFANIPADKRFEAARELKQQMQSHQTRHPLPGKQQTKEPDGNASDVDSMAPMDLAAGR